MFFIRNSRSHSKTEKRKEKPSSNAKAERFEGSAFLLHTYFHAAHGNIGVPSAADFIVCLRFRQMICRILFF